MNTPGTIGDHGLPTQIAEVIEAAVHSALEFEGIKSGELSVTLLDDAAMTGLHAEYLGIDAPTDVLSFELESPASGPLGDIYIGYETGAAQAAELGIEATEELVRLAVHGVLHVLGYEHPTDAGRDSSPMFARQEALVQRFFAEPREE